MKVWYFALIVSLCFGCSGKTISGTYRLSTPGSRLQVTLVFDESGSFKEISKVTNSKSGKATEIKGTYSIKGDHLVLEYPKESAGDLAKEERERRLELIENGRVLQVPNNSKMRYEKSD